MTKDEVLTFTANVLKEPAPRPKASLAEIQTYRDLKDTALTAIRKMLLETKEQNFCSRCGKRTIDLKTIHTCTPPRDLNQGLKHE
jgi:NADH pyrophosphatase NudC (nudix superfamily)